MRLALIFALIAAPAFARDLPPEEPEFEKPEIQQPEPPEPPQPPVVDREDDNEEPPRITPRPPATALACPSVKCYTDGSGQRRAKFTGDIDPEMYKLGRAFCASVPASVTEVSACCLAQNGKYSILYSAKVSNKSHYKAKKFCTCVHGLD